jgi:hypothetical protein
MDTIVVGRDLPLQASRSHEDVEVSFDVCDTEPDTLHVHFRLQLRLVIQPEVYQREQQRDEGPQFGQRKVPVLPSQQGCVSM